MLTKWLTNISIDFLTKLFIHKYITRENFEEDIADAVNVPLPADTQPRSSMSQDPRQNSVGARPPPEYNTYVPYSREAPHLKPEYAPNPPPIGQPYFPPPPQSVSRSQGRRYEDDDDDDDDDDDGYYSDRRSRRPPAITRRSSSYHGPRGNDDYYNERQLVQRRGGGSSHDGSDVRSRDGKHHGIKEAEKYFTKSPVGIGGAVAGAVIGGWAAKKAQVATGRKGEQHGSNAFLTLLGAAAGGLVVNAVIDKFEDRKKTAEKEQAWEEQRSSEDERDDRRGRKDSGYSPRHRSRSYSND